MRQIMCRSFLIVLLATVSVSVTWGQRSDKCHRWDIIAGNSTQSHQGLRMRCQTNATCTGIACGGIYHYSIPPFSGREIDFCFGFRLNPCDSPVSTDIYLQVPEKSVSYVTRTTRSNNIQVPKLTYELTGNFIKADVFLDVTMGTVIGGHLSFGVDVAVRADYTLSQTWPEGLRRSLVPRQKLLVQRCTNSSRTPRLIVGKCVTKGGHVIPQPAVLIPSTGKKLNPKPIPPLKPIPTTTTKSPGSGKACNPGIISSCPPNEMCKLGFCACVPDYINNGGCMKYTTTAGTPNSSTDSSPSTTTAKTTVIASVVVASIVGIILLVIVVIIIVRWRRARAQYANHELLLNNDDNMVM